MLWRGAASLSGRFRSVTLFCDEDEKYIQDHFADEVRVTSETYT
jgi:hypothetical protein